MVSEAGTGVYERDGPYSWLVLVTIILCNFSSYGFIAGNGGVMTGYYPTLFDEEPAKTNVITSVAAGVLLFSVPVWTLVMKVVGCRVTAAAGALLTLIGLISAAFVTQIWQLVIAKGVVLAVGSSLIFTSSVGVIPHYFHKRKAAAYTGIGLGVGIGFTAHPIITSAAFDTLGYKIGMLSLLPIIIPSIAAPFVFKPQLPIEKGISFSKTLSTYAKAFRHFVTPFFLVNGFFIIGGRVAMNNNLYGYITQHFGDDVAVVAYTIHGLCFLAFMVIFTLYGLKFQLNYFIAFIIAIFTYGLAVCLAPSSRSPVAIYIFSGVLGAGFGTSLGLKGNLAAHLFPAKDITFVYGLTEAVGGAAAFILPLIAGYVDASFGHGSGFYFIGACCILSGLSLCLPAVIRPKLWRAYKKREKDTSKKEVSTDNNLEGTDMNGSEKPSETSAA